LLDVHVMISVVTEQRVFELLRKETCRLILRW